MATVNEKAVEKKEDTKEKSSSSKGGRAMPVKKEDMKEKKRNGNVVGMKSDTRIKFKDGRSRSVEETSNSSRNYHTSENEDGPIVVRRDETKRYNKNGFLYTQTTTTWRTEGALSKRAKAYQDKMAAKKQKYR